MAHRSDTPDLGKLRLDDDNGDDVENLFASPESGATTSKHTPSSVVSSTHKQQKQQEKSEAEIREARLKAELERIREINRVIEGVTASLTKAKNNMETVSRTVSNASTLLATWTRILSQTEHNQRLILNSGWSGATQDLEDIESEDMRRQQDAERRSVEEVRRKEEAVRKAEEDERRRATATPTGTRGTGRGRGTRGLTSSSRGYVGVGGQSGRGRVTTGTRGGTGAGRSNSVRGRGRGVS